jgi:hypothetical protein
MTRFLGGKTTATTTADTPSTSLGAGFFEDDNLEKQQRQKQIPRSTSLRAGFFGNDNQKNKARAKAWA